MSPSVLTAPADAPLDLLGAIRAGGHERVLFCHDPEAGLQAIIAIHSTALGPANGGVRMRPYRSTAEAALDALRLSRAMTYKWAAAGEDRGGGKSVIVGDPATDKSEALLRAFGRHVDELAGRYWVGEDVGITLADMEVIHVETDYVATLPERAGGIGDIAPATARGVLRGMQAAALRAFGSDGLDGRRIALQGLGACGSVLLDMLVEAGAKVVVCDVDRGRLEAAAARHAGITVVDPATIYDVAADVFAPCALGQVIDDETIARLRVKVIAGSANNILAAPQHGAALARRGIICVPDFILNAGGAIYDADQFRKGGFRAERAWERIDAIYDRVLAVLASADQIGRLCTPGRPKTTSRPASSSAATIAPAPVLAGVVTAADRCAPGARGPAARPPLGG
jgi:leucine dehydrogenase